MFGILFSEHRSQPGRNDREDLTSTLLSGILKNPDSGQMPSSLLRILLVTDQPRTRQAVPAFSPQELMANYLRGRFDAMSESFLAVLRHFRATTYHMLDAQGQRFVNEFAKHFLTLFTQHDYVPARTHLNEFVSLNPTISNLVALSSFRTTDSYLALLSSGPGDFGKYLALCSARNSVVPDRKSFFDVDPPLACLWYGAYAELYRTGLVNPVVWKNLNDHFAFEHDRLNAAHLPMMLYFASTYVDDNRDRTVRAAINRSWKAEAKPLQQAVKNRPDPRKIAILSSGWTPIHSAYRITKAYVEALEGYHLTFVPLGSRKGLDLSLFQDVNTLAVDPGGAVDIRPVLDNDFMVAYYPEVGLSAQGILLTNLRIAPIQIASLGHSVSTWGAEVDYFFSGEKVEPRENPERNYSERLVLLPGCGAVHERPLYSPTGRRNDGSEFIVNCPWNAQKANYPLALAMKEMFRETAKPVRLRLFVSGSLNRQNDYLPFVRDLQAMLNGPTVEVVLERPYQEYMALMEEGDITLDSYPFGGCNTVADSLFIRKLIVCREGDLWYNRIGPEMLRMVGLPELVATTEVEHIAITRRLMLDDAFRQTLQERLKQVDFDATIFDRSEAKSFRKAVDFLIENHAKLSREHDRSPIRIGG